MTPQEKEIIYLPIKTIKDTFTIGACGKFDEAKKHLTKTEAIYLYAELHKWIFADQKEKQIRQNITMVLSKPLSKNKIYQIINQVESQPIKFN